MRRVDGCFSSLLAQLGLQAFRSELLFAKQAQVSSACFALSLLCVQDLLSPACDITKVRVHRTAGRLVGREHGKGASGGAPASGAAPEQFHQLLHHERRSGDLLPSKTRIVVSLRRRAVVPSGVIPSAIRSAARALGPHWIR